jgi:hypothetical protein
MTTLKQPQTHAERAACLAETVRWKHAEIAIRTEGAARILAGAQVDLAAMVHLYEQSLAETTWCRDEDF